ncbi:MAG TPA: MFS transporter, partial [Acidimicrobiales bacterium]|nr:MFS transporter [Acidimicrobiales bacterium]
MSDTTGWQPLSQPQQRAAEAFAPSPFVRLARTHALLVAGDALIALALAGSLFFSIDPSDARWRVGLYLVLTMAPFAIVSPLIGPALDRMAGGRRWMIIGSGGLRAVIALLMVRDLDSLLLFPYAFAILVLGKGYHVAKSAVVPTTVASDEALVEANAKLSLLSGVAGAVAVVPGLLLAWLGGPQWVTGLAAVVFAAGAIVGLKLPATTVAPEPEGAEERAELRSAGILLSASAMGLLRGIVGFLTFLLAFELRGEQERPFVAGLGAEIGSSTREVLGFSVTTVNTGSPTWHFGVVAALAAIGGPLAAVLTPRMRRATSEERIIVGALGFAAAMAALATGLGGLVGAAAIGFAVAMASVAAKLAFDSIVQRDAPDVNRGRSFARFETRFQLIWVVGAFIPVVIPLPGQLGYLLLGLAALGAAVSYELGRRSFQQADGVVVHPRRGLVPPRLAEMSRNGAKRAAEAARRRAPIPGSARSTSAGEAAGAADPASADPCRAPDPGAAPDRGDPADADPADADPFRSRDPGAAADR